MECLKSLRPLKLLLWLMRQVTKYLAEKCIRRVSPSFYLGFAHWCFSTSGQGCKVCPYTPISHPHCKVTREDLCLSLLHTKKVLHSPISLHQQLVLKTLSLWSSFCKFGCGAAPFEETWRSDMEQMREGDWNAQKEKARRGHNAKVTCDGRLLFEYDYEGKPYVR